MTLQDDIRSCRICAERFTATATAHAPRPVPWFDGPAPILIASQAPGARVHEAQKPFWDRSGDRLREWLDMSIDAFHDRSKVAIVPMAFCFPGYDAQGSDLAPPRVCAATWRDRAMVAVGKPKLTLLIGGYAQHWHLGSRMSVTERVQAWRDYAPGVFPLPHPSWRNTGWLNKNPWFSKELLPALKARVQEVLS